MEGGIGSKTTWQLGEMGKKDTETQRLGDAKTLNHAPNHVGFGISPELHVVQDRVQGIS
jgi:hypothetical protein